MIKMNEQIIVPEEEIIVAPKDKDEAPIEREDIVVLADEAEKRVEAVKKIITTALRVTNHFDWVKQGFGEKSRPYLCASGAEKIANLFRVRIYDTKAEKFVGHDDKGEYYFYVYSCKASTPDGHTIETEGTCSSRDQFFAQRKDTNGNVYYLKMQTAMCIIFLFPK